MVLRLMARQRFVALGAIAVAAACLLSPRLAQAQEQPQADGGAATAETTEPVLVVSLGSVNTLMQDVNYVTSAVRQSQLGGMFTVMLGSVTDGLDPTLPIGIVVPLVNGTPEPIALVPTPDVQRLLKKVEAQAGPAEKLSDGTFALVVGANSVFIRQVGDWAVVARKREFLDLAPADPMSVLGEMGAAYDIAFQVRMQQVPPQIRSMLVAQIRQGFEQAMAQQSPDEPENARQAAEATIQQLEQLVQDTDELRFGLDINPAEKQVAVDMAFTAVSGTELASMYSGQVAIPSRFSSVIRDDAAGYYHAATSISASAIEQAKKSLENSLNMVRVAIGNEDDLSDEEKGEITALIDRVADLAIESISEGKADTGAVLLAGEDQLQFAFGSFVSDGDEAAQIVKDLAEKLKGQPNAPEFTFDYETYNGVTMHLVEAKVPETEEEVRALFGETIKVFVGTAPKAVYLGLDESSEPLLKNLIDSAGQDDASARPLGQLQVKLMPILQLAQSVESNESIAAMLDSLARSPDPGVVRVVSRSIPNGQESKIVVGEGLLQAIGAVIIQAQTAGQQF